MFVKCVNDIPAEKINVNSDLFLVEYRKNPEKIAHMLPLLVKVKDTYYPSIMQESLKYQLDRYGKVKYGMCIDSTGNMKELFHNLLTIKKEMGGINPIEKSMFIKIFENYVGNEIFKYLEIPLNDRMITGYRALNVVSDSFKEAIVKGKITDINAIEILSLFNRDDWNTVFNFIMNLKTGTKKRNEIINMLFDISKRDNVSVEEIVSSENIIKILKSKIDPPQKAERIYRYLYKIRYPEISKYADILSKKIKNINLPRNLHLEMPRYFEKWEFNISFRFKNIEDFKKGVETLNQILKSKNLEEFLKYRY